jgi:hypothetical protein
MTPATGYRIIGYGCNVIVVLSLWSIWCAI